MTTRHRTGNKLSTKLSSDVITFEYCIARTVESMTDASPMATERQKTMSGVFHRLIGSDGGINAGSSGSNSITNNNSSSNNNNNNTNSSSNTGSSSSNNAPNDGVIHHHNHSSSHSNLFASASLFNIDAALATLGTNSPTQSSANDVANLIGPMEKRFHKKIVYKPLPLTLLQELRQLHFENLSSEISPYFVLPADDKPTEEELKECMDIMCIFVLCLLICLNRYESPYVYDYFPRLNQSLLKQYQRHAKRRFVAPDMPSFELTLQYVFPTQSEAANGASTQQTAATAPLSAEQKKKEKSKTQCINEQYDKLLQDIMASCNVSIDRIKTWKDKIHISSPFVHQRIESTSMGDSINGLVDK
ncbi:hypothetical protein RFI_38791, partial [Reticulomyxa filosa]